METSDDPMTIAMASMGAGTGMGVMSTLQQGKDLEKIAKARAEIDMANADAAARRASEAAKIKIQEGKRLLASQRADFAAGGINVDMGSPVVVAAQTRADVLRDVGFILEGGEAERTGYLNSAQIERARGKKFRRQSKWDAWAQGIEGGASMGELGGKADWWDWPL
jgi:hypothetical protein